MYAEIWQQILVEFLGTLTLVFVIASAVALTIAQGGSILGSALAYGLAFAALFYAWGFISGGHFNPATSFGFAVAGRMNWGIMIGFWIAQLLGGIAAGALVLYFFGDHTGAGASIGSFTRTDQWKAFLVEAIITFILVISILLITRNPLIAVASGLAIGIILTFNFLWAGPLTGASANPARSLGPAIFSHNLNTYWIYAVGPLVGALVAGIVYRIFATAKGCCDKVDACGKPIVDECGYPLVECKVPIKDACGRVIKDCDGPKYEVITKRKLPKDKDYFQHTLLTEVDNYMKERGIESSYLLQEAEHAAQKAKQTGIIDKTVGNVRGIVDSPQVESAAQGLTERVRTFASSVQSGAPLGSALAASQSVPLTASAPGTPSAVAQSLASRGLASPAGNYASAAAGNFVPAV